MQTFVTWFLSIVGQIDAVAKANPDPLSLLIGTLGAYAFGLILEAYFLPVAWSARKQKAATVACTAISGVVLSVWMWSFLDPADSFQMRLSVAIPFSLIATIGYAPIARWVTAKIPIIGPIVGTAWKL